MPSVSPVPPGTDCGHLPRSSVKGRSWEVNALQKQLIGFHSKQCTQASVAVSLPLECELTESRLLAVHTLPQLALV